ncbi:MAG: hypothetical protein ACLFUB_14175 [Cyclobacteriaceae bacterium]
MKKYIFSLLAAFILISTFTADLKAQEAIDNKVWKALAGVTYKITEDEYGELYVPQFSEEAKSLEGKVVTVPGYIIPFEGLFKPEHVIVSSLPLASCFFCGSGGPETVMEVYLKEPIDYTEAVVAFKGRLKLNDKDYEQLMYILEDAELVGEVGK